MAGLYIHIPYCHSKCYYCDFLSTPSRATMPDYIDALGIELDMRCNETEEAFDTVYIGGGTPSILPTTLLEQLVSKINSVMDISSLAEFTIEANPEDINKTWCNKLRSLGITRVSMGIQSFIDDELRAVGRRHTAADACQAIDTLRSSGISEISGDLIYGLPGQTIESWNNSLSQLLEMELPHFSAYLLSYEKGTRLYARLISGKITEATEDDVQNMYDILCHKAAKNGYEHYEISNFSLPGHNAIHNSNYWRDRPYLGIGVAAHSFDKRLRRFNGNSIAQYIKSISMHQPFYTIDDETGENRHNDYIITALRTSKGINIANYTAKYGQQMTDRLISTAGQYLDSGKMALNNNYLSIKEKAMLISDRIMLDFII